MYGYIKLLCLNQGIYKSFKCNNFICIDRGKIFYCYLLFLRCFVLSYFKYVCKVIIRNEKINWLQ